jgi:hypothetical protein
VRLADVDDGRLLAVMAASGPAMKDAKLKPSLRYESRTRYVPAGPPPHECPECYANGHLRGLPPLPGCSTCGSTGVAVPTAWVCSFALP